MPALDPVVALAAFGGTARRSQLVGQVSRRSLNRAVRNGQVIRTGRVYAVPPSDEGLVAARQLFGVASHRSAATHHGFALPPGPDLQDVTIPPRARRAVVPDGVQLHWSPVPAADRDAAVTSQVLTVVHSLRDLPLRDALAIGDSALRSGVPRRDIWAAVAALRGPGSAIARTRSAQLDARAENAFESAGRAILIAAGITGFLPQVVVRGRGRFIGRVDLGNRELLIAIELDGAATHAGADAMVADCVRHTSLTAAGWRSLRFTWEQVMFRPGWVLEKTLDTIEVATRAGKATKRPLRTQKPAA